MHALLLKYAFYRQGRTFTSELHFLACDPHLVTAAFVAAAIETEFVLLHMPLASALAAHRVGCERTVCCKYIGPVRFVCDFHTGELRPNLRAAELLKAFRGCNTIHECKRGKGCGDYDCQALFHR